jgi:xylulokinase
MMPGFTAPKLLWVARNEPEIYARTARVLLPKDYIRLKLTGDAVSDMSDASGTGWLDVGRRDWSDEMLAATGLNRSHMPRLVEGSAPSAVLTRAASEQLRLPQVIVAGGAGDCAASAVGIGVINPGQSFLSLGTSGVLFVVTNQFRPNPDMAAHAFCHCLPDRWHQMSVMLTAGSALEWFAGLTGERDLVQLVNEAQRQGLQRTTPYFLPYLSGERTPHNNPDARGVFFGLDARTTRADLSVAVLEGVALAFADGMDVLLQGGGEIGEIGVTGGGARISYWGQLLSSALNRTLTYRIGTEIGAAMGAARLGRMALTGESPQSVSVLPPMSYVIQPDADMVELLAHRRRVFARLYRNLKDTFVEFAT